MSANASLCIELCFKLEFVMLNPNKLLDKNTRVMLHAQNAHGCKFLILF